MNYTESDVIMWKTDSRLIDAKGKACWMGKSAEAVLAMAQGSKPTLTFEHIHSDGGFVARDAMSVYPFVILEKMPTVKTVPFDLSSEDDRRALMGRTVRWQYFEAYQESLVMGISYGVTTDHKWVANLVGDKPDARELFTHYRFADTGKPVGKEIEEVGN